MERHIDPGRVVRSVLTAAVAGLITALLLVSLWAVITVLLTRLGATPRLGAAGVTGLIVGALSRGAQLAGVDRRLRPLGIGAGAGAVWLLASGFRPIGMEALSLWGVLSSLIVWYLIAWITDRMFSRVPQVESFKSELIWASVEGLRDLGILVFTLIVLFPFYFMVASSLKSRAAFLQNPSSLSIDLSRELSEVFVGYIEVMTRFNFGRYIINSTFVAIATVILTLIPAILGAYAVTRLQFPGRNFLSRSILLIYMFPAIILVIPLYSVFSQLGLRDTLPGLLVVYPAMTIPVALYMLRSYFMTLPKDIEESGLIDGCNRFEVIWRITIPLSVPALASVALYVFMIAWNEFLFAFMFLDSPEIFTLSRGVVSLNSQEVPRQFLMAGAVIITLPVMVLFFWFERFLVGGLAAGGVKG
ncbi:MAG: carbohydrate ABC transporter permease [Spirochaetaceae bacterium]